MSGLVYLSYNSPGDTGAASSYIILGETDPGRRLLANMDEHLPDFGIA